MRTVQLTIEYDGTDFHGWQVQPGIRTVQGMLEGALVYVTKGHVRVRTSGAARTDTGVHALGQVASFSAALSVPVEKMARVLNSRLPPDMAVVAAREVGHEFHARSSARARSYRYRVRHGLPPSPLERLRAWHVPQRLSVAPMREAADALLGRHDFAAFMDRGSPVRTTGRTVLRSACLEVGEGELAYEIEADSFLYNMVRIVTGTLVEVGQGKRTPAQVAAAVRSHRRIDTGVTAPPHGLYLVGVYYPPAAKPSPGERVE